MIQNCTLVTGTQVLASGAFIFATWSAWKLFIKSWFSPLRRVPAPGSKSFIWGNIVEVDKAGDIGKVWEGWFAEFGHVFVAKGFFNTDRVVTTDRKAIHHVLHHNMLYYKPSFLRNMLGSLIGEGLVFSEGYEHKLQRRIMTPAFTTGHIRELTGLIIAKSIELRDTLLERVTTSDTPGEAEIEVLSWLSRTTLDIIGLCGFNYSFNAVRQGEEASELSASFSQMFKGTQQNRLSQVFRILRAFIPFLSCLNFMDPMARTTAKAQRSMRTISKGLVQGKQCAIMEERASGGETTSDKGKERDLLSLMIKANMDTDVPEGQRLTVDQVMQQIPTFIIAGHETTSTSTTWALYALSLNPQCQMKLRGELRRFPDDSPSMDELNSFPYLDAVVRETMRLYPAVEVTTRVATQDDIIPLDEPFTDKDGQIQHEIRIRKGEAIMVPIVVLNRLPEIWGEDSHTFNPERWLKTENPTSDMLPGVWANLMTFLGGPRSCIGYKFALIEVKALLFHLIRSFEVALAVPVEDIGRKTMIVTRPYVKSQREKGNQLPLIIKVASTA